LAAEAHFLMFSVRLFPVMKVISDSRRMNCSGNAILMLLLSFEITQSSIKLFLSRNIFMNPFKFVQTYAEILFFKLSSSIWKSLWSGDNFPNSFNKNSCCL